MGIIKEDVERIAKELHINVTAERIDEIVKEYPMVAENMPNENWTYIVEDMLYE